MLEFVGVADDDVVEGECYLVVGEALDESGYFLVVCERPSSVVVVLHFFDDPDVEFAPFCVQMLEVLLDGDVLELDDGPTSWYGGSPDGNIC